MTLKEMMNKNSFKRVFNSIYREYLKGDTHECVVEYDLAYRRAWRILSEIKGIEPSYKIHLVQKIDEDEGGFIDTCLYCEKTDEIFAVDFLPWCELINAEIIHPPEMGHRETLAHILWEITFWGFCPEDIQTQADSITEERSELVEIDDLLSSWK